MSFLEGLGSHRDFKPDNGIWTAGAASSNGPGVLIIGGGRLPKASPVVLLVTFPLSVPHVLTRVLGHPRIDVELNDLPIFAELAPLLSYHPLTLVLFGSGIKSTLDAAAHVKAVPGLSLQRVLAGGSPILDYTVPRPFGSAGALRVLLHTATATWTQRALDVLNSATSEFYPDALLALNAGLRSYHARPEMLHVPCNAHILCVAKEMSRRSSLPCATRFRPCARQGPSPCAHHERTSDGTVQYFGI
ncbi:hypothetical protein PsYK624_054220 [Phanerochaete sordida]|uniref:Uncharacterized protein n=1 Tax=Phanerochaete sordida TaxID=48140 RepID=A0A9P3LCK8_9APHY|nr:hypothetical protein PsYK624_054220 [Phanerochaete sordida]